MWEFEEQARFGPRAKTTATRLEAREKKETTISLRHWVNCVWVVDIYHGAVSLGQNGRIRGCQQIVLAFFGNSTGNRFRNIVR